MRVFNWFARKEDSLLKQHAIYDLTNASNGLTQQLMVNYNKSRPNGAQPLICYSPSKNMYFGHRGIVTTCCYNRDYHLGRYPEATIKEIWFGQKSSELRMHIKNNNLSYGCEGCLTQILAENFDATKAKQYDHFALNDNGYQSVMEFELDNTCNLECTMCSGDFSSLIRINREKRPPLKDPYDKAFVEQLKEFIPYLEEVKFYGGEPFLIEIYYDIIDLIIQIKPTIRISIQTNATILNNRIKAILDKAKVHLNLSIDSLEKENYESIRINAKFERVMENLLYFRQYAKANNTFFGISVCAMRQNWHELPNFVRFCNQLDAPVYFHTIFNPSSMALHSLPPEELAKIAENIGSATNSLPETSTIEAKNKAHIKGLVKQISDWQQRTLEPSALVDDWKVVFGNINSNEELIEIIETEFLGMDEVTQQTLLATKNGAVQKLRIMASMLPLDFDFKPTFRKIPISNPTIAIRTKSDTIVMLITNINNSSIEHMLESIEQPN